MSQSAQKKKVESQIEEKEREEDVLVESEHGSYYRPLISGSHDKRRKMVELLNDDLSNYQYQDKIDEISQSCYEHWLASSDDSVEIKPNASNGRLIVGQLETPLASCKRIHGTQIDGGSTFKGMYLVDETTIMNRSTIQISKACKTEELSEMFSTTYLIRFFTLENSKWQIDPLAVYYQLSRFSGIKRNRVTVENVSTQTDLTGEALDDIINKRLPV